MVPWATEIVSVIGILQKAFWPPSQRSVLRLIAAPYKLIPVILGVVLGDATQGWVRVTSTGEPASAGRRGNFFGQLFCGRISGEILLGRSNG
jgi:hypothetical protein